LITFDFSTLYISLPQDQFIEATKLLEKSFSKNKFLVTNGFKTFWSSNNNFLKQHFCFTEKLFFDFIEFLIQNSFIAFGNSIFKQTIGIPMGANYSPLLADLFLFSCEYNFMKNIDIYNSYRFKNITRYIDDVAVINFPDSHTNLS